jgi:glycosyltransferase involved in cell wall biosynthesis
MLTYNHAAFVEEAVRSVLAQQCDFPFEIVLADDASTDGTLEKVMEMQRQRPDVLRVLPAERNLGIPANFKRCLAACRAPYIAMLEGDDFWTDGTKLQRQVDQLTRDNTLTLSACRTRNRTFWAPVKERYTLADLLRRYRFHTSALVFRKEAAERFVADPAVRALDSLLIAHLATGGDGGFIDREMSYYRRHAGGAWSGLTLARQVADTQTATASLSKRFGGRYDAELFDRELWIYGMMITPDLNRPVFPQWKKRLLLARPLLARTFRFHPFGSFKCLVRLLLLPASAGFSRVRGKLGWRTRLSRWRAARGRGG